MPKAPKGIPREHPNAASSHMGGRCVAATSLRCCGGTPGDQDVRGTNELSKIESILGTRMSQNLSRDRRLACPVADDVDLDKVNVGDTVRIDILEAVSITVDAPK